MQIWGRTDKMDLIIRQIVYEEAEAASLRERDPNFIMRSLRDFLCGIFIGAGAILPGVSGGVLAVVFDIYRPFMEVLTHPRQALPKYWRFIPSLVLGWLIGFLGFAKGIAAAMDVSAAVTTWAFIGLIVGTLPSLFREAGKEGRNTASWVSLLVCAGGIFAGLFYVSRVLSVHLSPNFWTYSLCGGLWGLGIVVPGLATSSVLMALDLYQPLMAGLSALDIPVLLSTLPGLLATIFLLARLVNWVFQNHYSIAFHGILGIVAASTLVIFPTEYSGVGELLLSGACGAVGFLIAFFLGKLDRRTQRAK